MVGPSGPPLGLSWQHHHRSVGRSFTGLGLAPTPLCLSARHCLQCRSFAKILQRLRPGMHYEVNLTLLTHCRSSVHLLARWLPYHTPSAVIQRHRPLQLHQASQTKPIINFELARHQKQGTKLGRCQLNFVQVQLCSDWRGRVLSEASLLGLNNWTLELIAPAPPSHSPPPPLEPAHSPQPTNRLPVTGCYRALPRTAAQSTAAQHYCHR